MEAYEVLEIVDKFILSDGRCLLLPDFPAAVGLPTPISLHAKVSRCDGSSETCTLHLELTHFNIPASTDLNKRWRLVPRLSEINPDGISIGDKVAIFDANIAGKLLGRRMP